LVKAVHLFLGPAVAGGEVSEHKKIKTRISVKTGTFANISPSGVGGQTAAAHRARALDVHVLDEKRPPASRRRPRNSALDLIALRRALPRNRNPVLLIQIFHGPVIGVRIWHRNVPRRTHLLQLWSGRNLTRCRGVDRLVENRSGLR